MKVIRCFKESGKMLLRSFDNFSSKVKISLKDFKEVSNVFQGIFKGL